MEAPPEWDNDFSYAYYRRLLVAAASAHRVCLLRDAPTVLSGGVAQQPAIFLRHDLDFDLESATTMAALEAEMGVRATYHVLVNCPFYRIADASFHSCMRALLELKHEVGLHFDFPTMAARA